jgi:hypothetical protein
LAKITGVCPYALFALSMVFKYSTIQPSALGVAELHVVDLLSVMHNPTLLQPYHF